MEFNATFFISIVSFIAFTYLMNVILYRPLEKIVNERESLIAKNFESGKNFAFEAETLLTQKANELAKSKLEAKSILSREIKQASDKRSEIIAKTKADSIEQINVQKRDIQRNKSDIENELQNGVEILAQVIKDKLINLASKGGV